MFKKRGFKVKISPNHYEIRNQHARLPPVNWVSVQKRGNTWWPFLVSCKFGHVFRVIVFLQCPFIWFSFKSISSTWHETVLINFVEQVSVEPFSKAINTTKLTPWRAVSHIHLYRILEILLGSAKSQLNEIQENQPISQQISITYSENLLYYNVIQWTKSI